LTGAQWDDLKLLKLLLEPFMVFQRQLEGDKYVISSLLLGMVSYVRTSVKRLVSTFERSGGVRPEEMANLRKQLLERVWGLTYYGYTMEAEILVQFGMRVVYAGVATE